MPPDPCPTCRGQRKVLTFAKPRFAGGPGNWKTCETCRGSGLAEPLPERVEGEQA